MNCIACGVPDFIENTGTILIKGNDLQVEMTYQTIMELEDKVHSLLKRDPSLLVSSSTMRSNHPIKHFLKMVQNNDLINLMKNQSFTTHFQPIIDLQNSDELFAYECLLRPQWKGKFIPPNKLFEFAHETNFHNFLDQKARESSIVSARKKQLPKNVKLFINFLPSSIYNPEFCLQHTFKIVGENKIAPSQLVFEVVESERISDIDHLESIFKTYKRSGMQVALDDVGTGYATLEVLEKLQPDFVKIDRKYVSHCDSTLEKQLFLKNVVNLAAKLKIKILAEGIERTKELEFCRNIGIHYGQGYLIGKPSPDFLKPALAF